MNKEENICSVVTAIQNVHENVNDLLSHEKQLISEGSEIIEKTDCTNHVFKQAVDDQDQFTVDDDNDIEDLDINNMTGSYVEISFDQKSSDIHDNATSRNEDSTKGIEEKVTKNEKEINAAKSHKEKKRPDSLVLSKNVPSSLNYSEVEAKLNTSVSDKGESWKKIHRSQQTTDSQTTSINNSPSLSSEEYAIYSPGHHRTGSDTSGISELQGTITIDGDMVSFVAEDLQEKIKLSSPVAKWPGDSPSYSGSRSSTPSLYKQTLQSQFPVIDPGAIADLEMHSRKVAACVDIMLENLSGTLQSISSLTVDYMETYETSVCKTCDSVDTGIKTMYQLMAKCEELSNSVKPLYKISQDIKDIKKVLDHFENVVEHKS